MEGCDGLLRDKTRPSRNAPLGPEIRERVLALTLADTPDGRTHRTADMMATAVDNAVAAFFAKLSK